MPHSFLLLSPVWRLLLEPSCSQDHQATQFQGTIHNVHLAAWNTSPLLFQILSVTKAHPEVHLSEEVPRVTTFIQPSHLRTCQYLSFGSSHLDMVCLEQSPNYFGSPSLFWFPKGRDYIQLEAALYLHRDQTLSLD